MAFFADTENLHDDSTNVDMLSQLNLCCNDPKFDFAGHGVEPDDVLLSHEDVMSHFLNGQRTSRKSNPPVVLKSRIIFDLLRGWRSW